jgi:hypothetical protein
VLVRDFAHKRLPFLDLDTPFAFNRGSVLVMRAALQTRLMSDRDSSSKLSKRSIPLAEGVSSENQKNGPLVKGTEGNRT